MPDLRALIESREYTYCQAFYRDPTDDPRCVNGWQSRCEVFLVWTPSASEARERALTYARQQLGEPHEVHVYPRNYIREARQLLAVGQHEEAHRA